MSDLISRADALRELNGVCSNWKDDAKVAEIINALPSAEAVQGWIPCSERLPNEERHYLCCNKGYLPFTAHYHDVQWHCFDGITRVDAWMPLPTPYKGGDNE